MRVIANVGALSHVFCELLQFMM